MKIVDFFDRIYAINLPQRKDRRRMIVHQLAKAGLPLTPNKIEIVPGIRPDDAAGFPSIGARGCFLSHLTTLKQAQKQQLNNVLIVEDDLEICKQFTMHQEILVEQLRTTDWGFVYFGHIEETKPKAEVALIQYSQPLITAHFYGVNGVIFERLISFLEQLQQRCAGHPDGGPMQIDGAYTTFRLQNPDVVTLIASPNLGTQQSSRSDNTTQWFDQVPVLSQLASTYRAGKLLLKR